MGILIQATSLVYVFPSSLGQGASTRVSHQLGAGRPGGARRAAGAALSIGVAVGLAAATFMVSVRNHWGRMFTSDADILRLTAVALPIAGLCELGNCPQTAGCGVLRGSARPASGARINLASFYLVGMPVGVALAFGARLGFAGLWLGLLAAQAACAVWMARAVAGTDWDVEVSRAKELTKASTSNNHSSECNATTPTSDVTTVIATIATGGTTTNSNAAAAGCKNSSGYVPVSESSGGNDNELEKLEAGLMTSDDDATGASVSGSDDSANGGDTDAGVRENHGSSSSGGAGTTTATLGKEQRRGWPERAPLISVGDGGHDGDGRGGGQV